MTKKEVYYMFVKAIRDREIASLYDENMRKPASYEGFGLGSIPIEPHFTLPSANVVDVMFDQLEYLVLHISTCDGAIDCQDCLRFNNVKAYLLAPFNSNRPLEVPESTAESPPPELPSPE